MDSNTTKKDSSTIDEEDAISEVSEPKDTDSVSSDIFRMFSISNNNNNNNKRDKIAAPASLLPGSSFRNLYTTSNGISTSLFFPSNPQKPPLPPSAAASGPAVQVPTAKGKPSHNRVVSFADDAPTREIGLRSNTIVSEMGGASANDDDDDDDYDTQYSTSYQSSHYRDGTSSPGAGSNFGSPPVYAKSTLTLHQIRSTTPFESEAEAYIQNTLEEVDLDIATSQQQTLFANVPPQIDPETFIAPPSPVAAAAAAASPSAATTTTTTTAAASVASSAKSKKSSRSSSNNSLSKESSHHHPHPHDGGGLPKSGSHHKYSPNNNNNNNNHRRGKQNHHKATKSTAEDLFSLTKDLAKLHSRGLERQRSSAMLFHNNDHFRIDEYDTKKKKNNNDTTTTTSDGDLFVKNASNLVKRHNNKTKSNTMMAIDYDLIREDTMTQAGAGGTSDAASTKKSSRKNWGKIKAAVQVHAAIHSHHPKKTDEELPSVKESSIAESVEEEEEEEGGGGDIEAAMGSANDNSVSKSTHASNSNLQTESIAEGGENEEEEEDDDDSSSDEEGQDELDSYTERKKMFFRMRRARKGITSNYKDFEDWLRYEKISASGYIKYVFIGLILPLLGVATILFYLVGNPPCGTMKECERQIKIDLGIINSGTNDTSTSTGITATANTSTGRQPVVISNDAIAAVFMSASVSWWLLFTIRQIITFSLSLATQELIVDYLALRSRWLVRTVGPLVTLFIVQSQGWPMISFFWAMYDFLLLYGNGKFAQHWGYWQPYIIMMNGRNPSGSVTSNETYRAILVCALVVSSVVALKRFFLGLYLGKQTFIRYGSDLAKVMKKAVLITRVASLAREIEERTFLQSRNKRASQVNPELFNHVDQTEGEDNTTSASARSMESADDDNIGGASIGQNALIGLGKKFERKRKVYELLGEWEEPEAMRKNDESVAVSSIIQFRDTLSYLDTPYPFSVCFGRATTRMECIESSEMVYRRLLFDAPDADVLKFDTLALLAVSKKTGELDEQIAKDLIRLFRPDRDGNLTLVDFAKSIDTVYKESRLLRANVISSSKLDSAFGTIINIAFYIVVGSVALMAVKVNPFIIFASISSLIVGFAFMIGAAASKYFEGVLFILVRKPYNVGDRIHVSNVNNETSITGSPGWIVKDMTLFTTTVIFGATNEVATYSNGSLASSRIINAARSPKANLLFLFKFPIDTPYKRIVVFKSAIEQFVKARPREWVSFLAFRSTRVEADLGFVEYIVVAQHRESWQEIGSLLTSKADLSSFALELMKQMEIRYRAPPMPVDLRMITNNNMVNFTPGGVSTAAAPGGDMNDQIRGHTIDDNANYFGTVSAMFEKPK